MKKIFKTKKKNDQIWWISNLLLVFFFVIMASMTIHTVITTWIGSSFTSGTEAVIKSWKEIALLLLIPLAVYVLFRKPKISKELFSRKINWVIFVYAILHFVIWLIERPDFDAAIAGVMFNLRFLAFFLLAQLLVELFPAKRLRELTLKIILIAAVPVVVFGAMQVLFLPDDVLTHVGYSTQTIEPFLLIDDNPDAVRINSTLRGPNPLGAYIASVALIGAAAFIMHRKWRSTLLVLAPLTLITLWGAQSRSAWLGLAVAGIIVSILYAWQYKKYRQIVGWGILAFITISAVFLIAIKDTNFYRQTILHDLPDKRPQSSSNIERAQKQQRAEDTIAKYPLGLGPGTAGTASFYNDDRKQLTESYYLQIGVEVGVAGLILYITLMFMALAWLWPHREDPLALALIGGLVATSVVNIFLHGWTDETLSYMLWGLIGLYSPKK